jgi:hypothetical protein
MTKIQRRVSGPAQLARADSVRRAEVANTVPFILRAWWLRDRAFTHNLNFGGGVGAKTLPMWSSHSDPLCDAANVDINL